MVWKPSPETPLTADRRAADRRPRSPAANGCAGRLQPLRRRGRRRRRADARTTAGCRLISATGSCRMGRRVGEVVGRRLGRSLLELGGNNAHHRHPERRPGPGARGPSSSPPSAPPASAARPPRRLIVHESIARRVRRAARRGLPQRSRSATPGRTACLMGPLINERAVEAMMAALEAARDAGGRGPLRRASGSTGRASSSSRRSSGPGPTCRSSARRRSRRSST